MMLNWKMRLKTVTARCQCVNQWLKVSFCILVWNVCFQCEIGHESRCDSDVAEISHRKSKATVNSAEGGCFYCTTFIISLNTGRG